MPIHDWTRVTAGTFHDFHGSWITHIKETLNEDLLEPPYYALSEQHAGDVVPDVLTLSAAAPESGESEPGRAVALAEAPPKVALRMTQTEDDAYRTARRTIAIRHRSGHRLVAMIEILSPGNKDGEQHLRSLVEKAVACIGEGIHLLVVDLFPPGPCDPQGIHGAIWNGLGLSGPYEQPVDQPLTLVAYRADRPPEAFIQPTAVGEELLEMPIFLGPGHYINVPLEPTYRQAYRGVPAVWRDVIEGRADA
ncbi:MAG: DUF4058 family protein [Planctomycetaceae bacterium]